MDDIPALTLVVGGFPLFRRGMVEVINKHPCLSVCAETDDPARALELCAQKKPALVVLDLELPKGDGLGLLRDIVRLQASPGVLVVSEREDADWLHRSFRTGASAYLSKRDMEWELSAGLSRLIHGHQFVGPRVTDRLLEEVKDGGRKNPGRGIERLSDREMAVFRTIAKGSGPSAAAKALGMSVKTVETHRQRIKTKLELRTSEDLKRKAATWLLSKTPRDD